MCSTFHNNFLFVFFLYLLFCLFVFTHHLFSFPHTYTLSRSQFYCSVFIYLFIFLLFFLFVLLTSFASVQTHTMLHRFYSLFMTFDWKLYFRIRLNCNNFPLLLFQCVFDGKITNFHFEMIEKCTFFHIYWYKTKISLEFFLFLRIF